MADGYLNFDTKINESGFNEGINKLGSLGKSGLSVVSKAMTGAVAAVGAGAAAIVKSSLGVVANMEQQVGGVETLFKDSAKTVIRNANNAFKTAQLCINHFIFIHIITNFRRKRNDGNVMGTADYVRKENLFTGTETFKGQGKRGPD